MTQCEAWITAAGAPNSQSMSQPFDTVTCVQDPITSPLGATITSTWIEDITAYH